MTNYDKIIGLASFYPNIEWQRLSKFNIELKTGNDNLKFVFGVSNLIHQTRDKDYEITQEDINYYNKFFKKWQEVEKQKDLVIQ